MFSPNQIAVNVLPNGRKIARVRIMEVLETVTGETMYRVVDLRDDKGASDRQLVARNKTWAVSAANLKAMG